MQSTEIADAPTAVVDAPPNRLRLEVVDALFAARGIQGPTAQARALGLAKSHWIRIRGGQVTPLVDLIIEVARFLGTTVEAIYGRTA